MQVDLGPWSYVDVSEEEQTTTNLCELQEKVVAFNQYQFIRFTLNEESKEVIKSLPQSSSRFLAEIILPPPEISL
ncbi:MAG: hypothetical protein HKM28_01285 [Flavobacteriaceae bacterium]|nr:hypothetical protein [Flavobacteriaceae bacterium]